MASHIVLEEAEQAVPEIRLTCGPGQTESVTGDVPAGRGRTTAWIRIAGIWAEGLPEADVCPGGNRAEGAKGAGISV